MFDIQKIGFSKRISAFLLDVILLLVLVTGVAAIFGEIVGYDEKSAQLEETINAYKQEFIYDAFENTFGTESKFNTNDEIDKFIKDNQNVKIPGDSEKTYLDWYNAQVSVANEKLRADEDAISTLYEVTWLSILNITISILVSYIVLEIVVPLLLKNGQTIGKKVFGIALMRIDGVKVSPLQLIVRTILGKYTIETMIPILLIVSVYFSLLSPDLVLFGLVVIAVLIVVEGVIFVKSNMSDFLHDKMALTVCVDIQSQIIFENEEALIEYKRTHPTVSGDGKPLSPFAESLFSVYSGFDKSSVDYDANEKKEGSYSGIQLGTISVDAPSAFEEKLTEREEKMEVEHSSKAAADAEEAPEEEAKLPEAILEDAGDESYEENAEEPSSEDELAEDTTESEDVIEENPAEDTENEPEEEVSEE